MKESRHNRLRRRARAAKWLRDFIVGEALTPRMREEHRHLVLQRTLVGCLASAPIYPFAVLLYAYLCYPEALFGGAILAFSITTIVLLLYFTARTRFMQKYYELPLLLHLTLTVGASATNVQLTGGGQGFFIFAYFMTFIGMAIYYPARVSFVLIITVWGMISYPLSEWIMGGSFSSPRVIANILYVIGSAFISFLCNRAVYELFIRGMKSQIKLEEAHEKLKSLDRAKSEFFANVSHEYRTPITLTLGPIEEILTGRYGPASGPILDQLQIMKRNQQRLLDLINQILDIAKSESGRMPLRASLVRDINKVVSRTAEQFRSLAKKQGLDFRLALDPRATGVALYLDLEKFEKILFNLLFNAHKFTEKGWIEASTGLNNLQFILRVSDSGIGIREDQIPHLFERFRQADGSQSRKYGGTGLGLALVKEFVELHRGQVHVRSEYGRGSAFEVSFPLGKAHLDPTSIVERAGLEDQAPVGPARAALSYQGSESDPQSVLEINRRSELDLDQTKPIVLCVDDNGDIRNYMRDLLSPCYNVFLATHGEDGLEKARKYKPDLILSDVMMPVMTGVEFCQKIRGDPQLKVIPFIMLTAKSSQGAKLEGLEEGADDYLTKPFSSSELLARVKNLVSLRQQQIQLVREIQERKKAQKELARSNQDLEEFAYIASHDLQEPLRTVASYAQLLLERYRDRLDPDANEFLRYAVDGVQRMQQLIRDLLQYSRVGTKGKEFSSTNAEEVLQEALVNLQVLIEERKARVTHHRLPAILGDKTQLAALFQNLIGNAIKFCREHTPQVWISAVEKEGEWIFSVKDNGIGIDPKDQEKIFKIFQRLHAQNEYPGTGIGLAVCQKIVERHGGKIWVESQPGKGSTFFFSLPKLE